MIVNGSNFDPATAEILITGTGCSPCTIPNSALTIKTSTQVVGPVTLSNSGSFSVSVENALGATIGHAVAEHRRATPTVSSLSPNPSPPAAGQQFSLIVNGSNFDPATAEILITGTGCSPCTIPNSALTIKTSTQVVGPVTLSNSGSFSVSVENVASGLQSGTLSLTVGGATPATPTGLSPGGSPSRARR